MKRFGLLALSAASLVLASCASLTPPVRPAYTGADMVDTAQASQLVGNWTVTNLNPYPDSGTQAITIRYLADGTLQGEISPQGEAAAALGDMQFMLTGEWQLDADTLTHRNVEMNTSGDNAMVSMVARMFNGRQQLTGEANIYEISANRIVMVGEDGAAMQYLRQ